MEIFNCSLRCWECDDFCEIKELFNNPTFPLILMDVYKTCVGAELALYGKEHFEEIERDVKLYVVALMISRDICIGKLPKPEN